MLFDPTGVWKAEVTGEFMGSQVTEEMSLTFTVFGDHAAEYDLVELRGAWDWAGLSGTAHGFWSPYSSGNARDPESCPTFPAACSLTLELEPPPNSCFEVLSGPAGSGPNYMRLLGWFEGPGTFMATRLRGTYWEGAFNNPCLGPVLLSINTAGLFSRT